MSRGRRTAGFLGVLLGGAGALHMVRPEHFDTIVPTALPGPARGYTYASGVAELAVAALLAVPRTRRLGGLAAAALFVAVFPATCRWRTTGAERGRGSGRSPMGGSRCRACSSRRRCTWPGRGPVDTARCECVNVAHFVT